MNTEGPHRKQVPVRPQEAVSQPPPQEPPDPRPAPKLDPRLKKKKTAPKAVFYEETGGDLLSRALAGQVPSALRGLTAPFGMGRGVSLSQ